MSEPQDSTIETLAALSQEIAQAPDSAGGYHKRAVLLSELRGYDQALADHRRAIELSPRNESFRLSIVETCRAMRNFDQAEHECRAAVHAIVNSARLWESLGRVLQEKGQFAEVADCFRRSLAIQPSGFVISLLSRMHGQLGVNDCQNILDYLNRSNAPIRDRVAAGFALGDVLDQAEQYDKAFNAYAGANALFKSEAAQQGEYFDGPDLKKKVDEMIATITPEYFRERTDFAHKSKLPVFIVGMPRSGTSLIEQILASHSRIHAAGELEEIAMIRARLAQTVPADAPRPLHRHWHRHLGKVHAARLEMWGGKALRVVDKMPGNILHLGLIATMLPESRVIFCQRDPRDTCLSCYFQLFAKYNLMFSYDLADCRTQYLQQERLTEHWKKVLPLRMLFVQYEQLVGDLENQTRRMIDFLGLDWEPACLNFHQTARPVLTRSVWQVRQPLYTNAVNRWRHYERHLGPLVEVGQ